MTPPKEFQGALGGSAATRSADFCTAPQWREDSRIAHFYWHPLRSAERFDSIDKQMFVQRRPLAAGRLDMPDGAQALAGRRRVTGRMLRIRAAGARSYAVWRAYAAWQEVNRAGTIPQTARHGAHPAS